MGDFSLLEMKALGSHISVFIICDSPQKSSTVRKVYKPDLCSKARLCTTSPSRLRRATSPCRRGFGSPRKVNGFARGSPTRGAVEELATRLRGCTKTEPFLCRKVRLLAFPVSFWRKEWYNGFAALPAHFMGREVKPNGVYFYLYPVRRSECSVLLHLQVA